MKDLFRAYKRISERSRAIAFGILALFKNLFYFVFKIIVGIIFRNPLLLAIAIYNLLIGLVKANCSRGLFKNRDDYKDLKAYTTGGAILVVSSIFYIVYTANQVGNPYHITYTPAIAIAIALFSTYLISISIMGLFRTKGQTFLIKEYRFTNFSTALTNLVLTQMAILSFMPIENQHKFNATLGIIVGSVILGFGLFIVIHGICKWKVYSTGITNAKRNKKEKPQESEYILPKEKEVDKTTIS